MHLNEVSMIISDLHNETGILKSFFLENQKTHNTSYVVNIHSHLFGAILFLGLLLSNQSVNLSKYESVIWLDNVVFTIFMIGAVLCLSWRSDLPHLS